MGLAAEVVKSAPLEKCTSEAESVVDPLLKFCSNGRLLGELSNALLVDVDVCVVAASFTWGSLRKSPMLGTCRKVLAS
jgi:hypothetical protein